MRAEIDLPNPDRALYPGMYAQVVVGTERHPDALTLPVSAVLSGDGGSFVYVVKEGRIEQQSVKTGMTDSGVVEVSDGLPEGAQVVAVARSAPAPGTVVKVSNHELH